MTTQANWVVGNATNVNWQSSPVAPVVWQMPASASPVNWKTSSASPVNWSIPTPSPINWIIGGGTGGGSSNVLSITAGAVVSALRCIVTEAGLAYPASSLDLTNVNAILGISVTAASIGNLCSVQFAGVITDSSFNWVDKKAIFCAADGSLTQTPPTVGFLQQVGVPKSPTSFEISIQDATIRT